MGTKTYDNANDLITFSRASGGTALRKISYGSELVTNGTFDTDVSGWSVGTGGYFSWVDGTIEVTGSQNSTAAVGFTTVIGNIYRASGEHINNGTGGWIFKSNSPTNFTDGRVYVTPTNTAYGVSSVYFVATSTTTYLHLLNLSGGTVGKFDNISVKEVLFDQPAGTLTLFNHPNNIPRIEYDAAGAVKGLLIEEAQTNFFTYSAQIDNAAWLKNSCTVTPDAHVSPDGTTNADEVVFTGVGNARLYQHYTPTSGVVYTVSFWVKLISGASDFWMYDSSSATSSPILTATGSWQRVSWTYTAGAGASPFIRVINTSATSTFAIYGAQLEAGSFPTSYISTSGATATRAADIASIPTSAFGYNQKEGSVYVDGTFRSGDTIVTLGSTTIAADADGVKDYTTTYSADPSATGMVLNRGTYKSIQYYPRRLTNAQLQELTT